MAFSTHPLALFDGLMVSGLQSEVQGNGAFSVGAISFGEGEMGGISRRPNPTYSAIIAERSSGVQGHIIKIIGNIMPLSVVALPK
jgi:hypothetical protein